MFIVERSVQNIGDHIVIKAGMFIIEKNLKRIIVVIVNIVDGKGHVIYIDRIHVRVADSIQKIIVGLYVRIVIG